MTLLFTRNINFFDVHWRAPRRLVLDDPDSVLPLLVAGGGSGGSSNNDASARDASVEELRSRNRKEIQRWQRDHPSGSVGDSLNWSLHLISWVLLIELHPRCRRNEPESE